MRRAVLIAGLLLIISCSGSASGADGYELGEFYISGPDELAATTDAVTVHNDGEFPHTLVVSTPDGVVTTATDLVMPGETVALRLDLEPGVYQFTCRIVGQGEDGGLIDHYERGMHASVAVSG